MAWKRRIQRILAGGLLVLMTAMIVWVVVLYARHGSLHFAGGRLASSQDAFLDNSGRMFQQVGWHLGNGLRTTGTTYGVKILRFYACVQVTHVDPRHSEEEANE